MYMNIHFWGYEKNWILLHSHPQEKYSVLPVPYLQLHEVDHRQWEG